MTKVVTQENLYSILRDYEDQIARIQSAIFQGVAGSGGGGGSEVPIEDWQNVTTFTNGWSAYGAPWNPQYRKRPDGRVELRGLVKAGTLNAAAFTLPVDYRPVNEALVFATATNTSAGSAQVHGELRIDTSGLVVPVSGNTGYVSVTCDFSTDQATFPTGPQGDPGPPGTIAVYEQPGTPGAGEIGEIWIDTDDSPASYAGPQLVSTLPTTGLYDGYEVYYLADATNGVVWHLRYRTTSVSVYKWEFLGGSPLASATGPDTTGIVLAGTGWTPVNWTGSPTLTVPRAGEYAMAAAVTVHTTAGTMPTDIILFSSTGDVIASSSVAAQWAPSIIFGERILPFAAAATVGLRVGSDVGTWTVRDSRFYLRPVRVS